MCILSRPTANYLTGASSPIDILRAFSCPPVILPTDFKMAFNCSWVKVTVLFFSFVFFSAVTFSLFLLMKFLVGGLGGGGGWSSGVKVPKPVSTWFVSPG